MKNVLWKPFHLAAAYARWARSRETWWGKWLAFGVPAVLGLFIALTVAGSLTDQKEDDGQEGAPKVTQTAEPSRTSKPSRTAPPATQATAEPTATTTPSPSPTETPVPTDTPAPATPTVSPILREGPAIEGVVRVFFDAYNQGNMIIALRYVTAEADRDCGGITEHAFAYVELQRMEKLRYEVVEVKVTEVEADWASADVTLNSFDIGTGEQVDSRLTLGYQFERGLLGDWVFDSDPLPVAPFCD